MENKRAVPAAGEFYRHFKGNFYQIIGVAKHSETMEQMVVYQALYGDYGLYTRPLEMFLSPVDREKYPEASQQYRFEQCMPGEMVRNDVSTVQVQVTENAADTTTHILAQQPVKETNKDGEEETVRPEILRFLDAEGAEAKLKVLRELRMDLDENLLTTIELSMDLLPNEKESPERRYELVEQTLEKRIRFEGGRLR